MSNFTYTTAGVPVPRSPLDTEQEARAEALRAARDVLAAKGMVGSASVSGWALMEVAHFILTGEQPVEVPELLSVVSTPEDGGCAE